MGDRSEFVWDQPPTHNYIDQLVYDKLRRVKILPSSECTDEEFVRRVSLVLTGLPPAPDLVRAFVAEAGSRQAKRAALVDRLIGSPAFVEYWTNKWSDMLQVNRKFLGEEGPVTLRNWIQQCVATNKPYDQFAGNCSPPAAATSVCPP